MANDVVRDVITGMLSEISLELGSGYEELPYMNDVSMNNFNANHNRYGVRGGALTETDTVTKVITVTQSFDVVLTKAYADDGISDENARSEWLDLQALMLDIYKRLINNKAGVPASIIDIQDLVWGEPQYISGEKVVALTASMNVRYRFSLI